MSHNIVVIIPAYNVEKFIKIAVESVLAQPYKNIKVLIINDGSTDSTELICNEIACCNDRVCVIHQNNAGVSAARNKGIDYVVANSRECDYVVFLDADDYWFDKVVTEELVKSFNEMDIIGMSTYISNLQGTRFRYDNVYTERQIVQSERGIVDWIFAGHFGAHFYSKSFFQKFNLRFMESVKYNEDVIFIREAFLCAKSVKFLSTALYAYRMNDASAVHTSKINLNNATDISFGWFQAKKFADSVDGIPIGVKKEWYKSCEMITGSRLLESAIELAKNGFDNKQIQKAIFENTYSYCYNLLEYESLCEWQRKPFYLLNENKRMFVAYYRIMGITMTLLRRISKMKILNKYVQARRYPLTKSDLISQE